MIRTLLRHTVSLLLLSSCLTVVAAESFDMNRLSALFEKYKRKEAYLYASEHLAAQEGDPYFDYYYGVSAIDSGFASQGVFALERVLLVFPGDPVARLELARGYFVLEEYARSRQEFETVLETDPPDSVKRTAYLYLDRIRIEESRYRTTWSGFVEIGGGYDTNVNSAPSDDISVPLTPSSLQQEDNFYNLAGRVKVDHPFAPGWKVNAIATAVAKKNQDLDAFDTLTGTLQTGLSLISVSSQYNADIVVQEFQLDGKGYRQLTGTNFGWKYNITELSNFTTSLQYAKLDYDIFPILDSQLYTLNLGYTHQFPVPTSPVLFTNIKLGTEDAKSDSATALANTERDIYSLRLGAAFSLSPSFVIQTIAGIQNSQYQGANILLPGNGKREDDFISADLNLLWLLNQDWRIDTRIAYIRNDSNIELREYDRLMASINLNYNF